MSYSSVSKGFASFTGVQETIKRWLLAQLVRFLHDLYLKESRRQKLPVPVPAFLDLEVGVSFLVLDGLGLDELLVEEEEEVEDAAAPFWGY